MALATVCVVRALGLGDLLTAVPALRALADAFPEHRLVLAAPTPLATLVAAHELADEVVDVDLRAEGRPAPERTLPDALHHADVAVNLHGRGPESTRMLAATRPRRLIAFDSPGAGVTGPSWDDTEHEVHRWCHLLSESGIAANPGRLDLHAAPDAADQGATVVHPGAASPARRWPARRWAAVVAAERRQGRRVLITGSRSETQLAHEVATRGGLGDEAVIAGRTDLLSLVSVVAGAARVVCGDTGVAHLATATRTPSVVLFGPTSPARWGPPPDRPWHRVIWRGRTGDPHALRPDPRLLDITAAEVVEALETLHPAQ